MDGYRVREATAADAGALARQRCAMFEAMGMLPASQVPALEPAVRGFLVRTMATGEFHAWVVEQGAVVVAGGGVLVRPLMPRPGYVSGEPEGLIVSMWTEPDHRRRGLGRRVLEAIIEWCGGQGIRRLALHASEDGRPLYALHGFRPSNEMLRQVPPR